MFEENETDVHPHHEEFAMGEVNNPHDAKDKRHPQGNQCVEPAHHDPGYNRLDKYREIHNQTPADFITDL